MSDRDHARALLVRAQKDLKALRGMKDATSFDDEVFGVHSQQAAEKGLKAWIALLGQRYPKTHDIEELLELLQSHGQDVSDSLPLVDLYPFAIQFRYESMESDDEPVDRLEILHRVENLLAHVTKLVGI